MIGAGRTKRRARARLVLLFASAATAALAFGVGTGAADTGYRDFSFGTAASAPTSKEPQSKVWFNDGTWWGSLYEKASGAYHVYRLDWATQAWTDTGTAIDERDTARSDALWDGSKLYVVTAGTNETMASHGARLLRFSYSSASKTYTLDTGFPIMISSSGTQATSIEKDTTGRLWITFTKGYKTYVAHSTTDDKTWVTPFLLPGTGNSSTGTNGLEEAAIVAFDGKIGIMYSNQKDWGYYFAIHRDGDPGDAWTQTVAHQATEGSDNHINVKGLDGDTAGRVFALVKTSLNASTDPLYYLLVRKSDGSWAKHVVVTVADDWTRAQVGIDVENREIYVFGSAPCCSGGTVYYKKTGLDSPSFASGKGTALIQSSTDTKINNVTSAKHEFNNTTGFLAVGGDDTSDYYLHSAFDLGSADTTPPDTTITSGPASGSTRTSTDATFAFTSSESGSSFECSLNGATFTACSSPKTYTGLVDGTQEFQVRAKDGVGNVDATPASRMWTVNTRTETVTFSADADARVEALKSSTNFGADPALVTDTSPNIESYIRFEVAGLAADVLNAKLRLYATNGTNNGPTVYKAGDGWTESEITWSNKPARIGSALEDKGSFPSKSWVEFDVTPAVTGNGAITFNLRPMSSDGADFYSLEASTANKPQLVIQAETDRTPPETTIDSGPSGSFSSTSAQFGFSADDPDSTFECSLDGAAFAACTSATTYSDLAEGAHTFEVRAMDSSRNVDPTPASRTWTVDTVAPSAPVITNPGEGSTTNDANVTISGTAEPGATVQIFDGGVWQGAGTANGAGAWSVTLAGVVDGAHVFAAKAIDAAMNGSAMSANTTVTVDTLAPDTTIDSGPSGPTASTSADFTFSATEPGATLECSLDGAAFASCTSPANYTGLAEGSHTLEVRAKDAIGNADVSPASRTWTADVTAPVLTDRAPAQNAIGVAETTTVTAVFSEPVAASTVATGTFTLAPTLGGAQVAAVVTYDSATNTATLDPDGVLTLGTTYTATVVGGADGVKDVAGNPVASDASWTFTTAVVADATPPETSIEAGPSGQVSSSSAEFAFSSSEGGSTFECSLDGAPFHGCTSPSTYTGLADGQHAFEVRATDGAGNTDPTPASRTWTADTIAPSAPTITSPADGAKTNATTVTVSGTAEANSTVEVLDGAVSAGTATADGAGAWSETLTELTDGGHTLTARATDAAANTSSASAGVTVAVDTAAPETTIDSGPSGTTSSSSATFEFSSTEAGSTFECSLDGAPFAACESPKTYSGLGETTHTLEVRSSDGVGNADATPATRSWTVSLTLFGDGFESGDFAAWSLVKTGGDGTATVQSTTVKSGSFAAQLSETANTGSVAYVRKSLDSAQTDVHVSGDFRISQEGASGGNVPLFRLFDANGARIVSLYRQNLSADKIQVNYAGMHFVTAARLPLNTWANFEVRVIVAGAGVSTVQVRMDGIVVYESTSADLGTLGVRTLQIGNDTAKQTFTLAADDVRARVGG